MLRVVAEPKERYSEMLTVKVTPTMLREAHIMAEMEHTKVSNMVRQFLGRKIDAARERKPDKFKNHDEPATRPAFTLKYKRSKTKAKQNNKG